MHRVFGAIIYNIQYQSSVLDMVFILRAAQLAEGTRWEPLLLDRPLLQVALRHQEQLFAVEAIGYQVAYQAVPFSQFPRLEQEHLAAAS